MGNWGNVGVTMDITGDDCDGAEGHGCHACAVHEEDEGISMVNIEEDAVERRGDDGSGEEYDRGVDALQEESHIHALRAFSPNPGMVARHGPYIPCKEVPCKAIFMSKVCKVGMLLPTDGMIYKGHQCHGCDHFYHTICLGE